MNITYIIKILLFVFSVFVTKAQIVSSIVFSKEENQPLPYVRIGNEKVNFLINLSKANLSSKFKIEMKGYQYHTESVQNFLKHTDQKIFLTEKYLIYEKL